MAKPSATEANANSSLLKLPDDVFRCVMDYLDRSAVWSLKRLCKSMVSSNTVIQSLYRYPIQLNDVRDLRFGDWKYTEAGLKRWDSFKASINDTNRNYVSRLALSHWSSIGDFNWIENNLPSLTCLDVSAIKDFVWTPGATWTWKMLAEACPKLFGRLEELEVANWADYQAHSSIKHSYPYNDYRFKAEFRISRREDGGSIAKIIFPLCNKLKLLGIREPYSSFPHRWNEWEVHQRVCCLVDGIENYCPNTMTKLHIHDYAPYTSLFSTSATTWSRLTHVDIDLTGWMEDCQDRDVIGPIPYRMTQGAHHRDEEKAFEDKSFEACARNHMDIGNSVVKGAGASFEDLLQSLHTIWKRYPNIDIRPTRSLHKITLHPFHLVDFMQQRNPFIYPPEENRNQVQTDPISNKVLQNAIRWLSQKYNWKPILAWDKSMREAFSANFRPSQALLHKPDVMSRFQTMVSTLRSLDIPIHVSIGDRTNTCPSFGLDGSLYFGDHKIFIGTDETRQQVLLPAQASFNLSAIAHLVDELTIQYTSLIPGVSGWLRTTKHPTPAEKQLMQREMIGWRRFWKRYACQFKQLKKLSAYVPNDIYEDWGKSELSTLLADKRWNILEVEDWNGDLEIFGSYHPFGTSSSSMCERTEFVQRVFFRLDDSPLCPSASISNTTHDTTISILEREEAEITDHAIRDLKRPEHRFWPTREILVKRKREETEEMAMKRRKVEEAKKFVQRTINAHFRGALDSLGGFWEGF